MMNKALKAEIGVRVPCLPSDVESVRKRLYKLRDRFRMKGNHAYDALKFRIYDCRELWIVKKDALDMRDDSIFATGIVEGLHRNDLYRLPKPPFYER